ncbi:MAG: winged helix-turn-helix domain-containing protein [Devosia sp.]
MLRFAGFELDQQRLELRRGDGEAIALRPKTFDLLCMFAARPRQVIGKDELMAAIWPNVHVGEDSLFQCIRELRLALGDDQRQLIRVVAGRGYRLDADIVDTEAVEPPAPAPPPPEAPRAWYHPERRRTLIAGAVLLVALVVVVLALRPDLVFRRAPSIAVMPIAGTGSDPLSPQMAASVTNRLSDGLAKIANFRVLAPAAVADFVVSGELGRSGNSWTVEARLTNTASNEVEWTRSISLDAAGAADLPTLQSRLAAGLGYDLALHLNQLSDANDDPSGTTKVLIAQATAYMNQTSIDRFRAAQTMLEDGLADAPANPDIEAALAAVLLRGVQMVWYTPEESIAARSRAGELLASALKGKPNSVAVQDANCRFLSSTNQFNQSLVTCARALEFDPWDGIALYHLGLAQMYLGRFEEAVATFRQADQFDTPEVSRWTWKLGIGWTLLLMDRPADALPWLEQAIAITPASGRVYLLVAAAHQQLGHPAEAAAAVAKCLELRPGSTAKNVGVPTENASPLFIAAADRLTQLGIAAGLPPA